ncbi:hypothetical protein AVEN_238483-1 [Araneus ventricosus]|uniref:Uncharacterized protein n=1 Tax=Araneus ventricosus TaxID=182803 RepID=A0A4Y2SXX0_ARAVE|nr:hypothetical protein AVEN_257176-1 [Araneus ventricosus]GBN93194.1 hypothetical protein AVEN_66969-1 [Araneus ventricosus]GBO44125.1 hypothetical protein AVEN_238483-1 [Araneus ventricosus]
MTGNPQTSQVIYGHIASPNSIRSKEHHPALLRHPSKQLKDRPPQQIVRHCGSCIIASITSGSCSNPPFYRGTTRHRKWAQRAKPPLLRHRIDESLLTYTAASPPRTHRAIGLTRACLLIRQPLLRELTEPSD